MEECEALCTQIAIMVNGQFKCLGSIQHLKSRFGEGYSLIARVGHPPGLASSLNPPSVEPLMAYIAHTFPGSMLKDIHQGSVHYYIPSASGEASPKEVSLAELFGKMEAAREEYHIEDYLISQTSLEQVFINFARAQIPPVEAKVGCCAKMNALCSLCFCGGLCLPGGCCCCQGRDEELTSLTDNAEPSPSSSGYQSIA